MVAELIHAQKMRLIGNVRQELLSGIDHQVQFDKLETTLPAFAEKQLLIKITIAQRSVLISVERRVFEALMSIS